MEGEAVAGTVLMTIIAVVKHLLKRDISFYICYSVCSVVVPRLEEAILTAVFKKNFK